jgi:putative transposase
MSNHVFHEIYLHFNWHTKNNQPLLTPRLEPLVHKFLRQRCHNTKGVYFHGIGGTADHIHLAINIEPFVCISDLVADLKGACSFEINKQERFKALEWQRGYGVVSFGKKNLPWVLEYIANQKEHHARGTIQDRLERTEFEEEGELEGGQPSPSQVEKPG